MSEERDGLAPSLPGNGAASAEAETRQYRTLYVELRRLAASQMRRERHNHTLTPTALVHEAWLRLGPSNREFESRGHFLALSAKVMRRILVDHARARNALCRGGDAPIVPLDPSFDVALPLPDEQIIALDEALSRLADLKPRAARVIELRFFAGLTEAQVADLLQVTRRTVNRDWEMARAWLFGEISAGGPE